jgi:Right handed beta helix region
LFRRSRKRFLRGAVCAAAALACLTVPAAATAGAADAGQSTCTPKRFFVSTQGDDGANGTIDKPWKTVEHARDVIRQRGLNKNMSCDIQVELRAGDYPVAKTIQFNEADSGSNGHSVVYQSYDGPGKARFLGARQITGWQKYKGNIYKTQVDKNQPFYTLYDNGQRATTARTPNRTSTETLGPYFQAVESSDDALTNSQQWMAYKDGDLDQNWDLHDAQVVVWSGGHWSWFTDTDPILNVNWTKKFISLRYPTRFSLYSHVGSRYFLQNSLDFLDEAGEYYLDHATGELYYWPRSGSIDNSQVWAPTVQTVFSVAGSSPNAKVHDLSLDGLTVQYTDFTDWYRYGWNGVGDSGVIHKYPDYDRQIEMTRNRYGAVTLTNTTHVALRRMHFADTGWTGVFMLFANDHDTISDSLFERLGGDGVKLEGGYPGEGNLSHDNVLTDNFINWVGELVPGDASGYEVVDSGHNELSNSVIQHSARYAVSVKAITTVANADNYAGGNVLKYLRIAHAGKDSGDMGAIDSYGVQNFEPHTIESQMSQITVDDVNADPSMPDVVPSGIHMDAGGCGWNFSNIKVTNAQYKAPFHGDTHCNTFENDSWNDGFDESKLELDKIGVTPNFPYPLPENTPAH